MAVLRRQLRLRVQALAGGNARAARPRSRAAQTGRLLWSFPDGQYTPVVADKDHLYLVGYARLYAFAGR